MNYRYTQLLQHTVMIPHLTYGSANTQVHVQTGIHIQWITVLPD